MTAFGMLSDRLTDGQAGFLTVSDSDGEVGVREAPPGRLVNKAGRRHECARLLLTKCKYSGH